MDQQLHVFVTVAEKRNFSKAAEHLHMSQPSVTQHIQALERDLGVRLMERNNRYIRLTKAGELVYHHAKEIVGLHVRLHRLIDDLLHKESGTLAIGASYTFGEYLLPRVVARFRKMYPSVVPSITIGNTRDISIQVANLALDVGVVEGEVNSQQFVVEPIADDKMVIVLPSNHPLANRDRIQLHELQDETWILRESGSGTRDIADRCFRTHHFTPFSSMEFGSTQAIKEAVEAGLGVSILSEIVVRKELMLGTLASADLDGLSMQREFSLFTVASPFQTKAVSLFVQFLREYTFKTSDDEPFSVGSSGK